MFRKHWPETIVQRLFAARQIQLYLQITHCLDNQLYFSCRFYLHKAIERMCRGHAIYFDGSIQFILFGRNIILKGNLDHHLNNLA